MKKFLAVFILVLLLIPLVLAVPPWKRETTTGSGETSERINWEMIGVILFVVAGAIGWFVSKRVRGKTAKLIREIDDLHKKHQQNPKKCEKELVTLREKIMEEFKGGSVNEQSLSLLEGRIDRYLKELRTEIIDKFILPDEVENTITEILADGIITKDEYEQFMKVLKKVKVKDKDQLLKLVKQWKKQDAKS